LFHESDRDSNFLHQGAGIASCDKAVPEALAKLNYVFVDDDSRFEESLDRLAEALDTDISWIRQHTEFGEQARRWALAKRPGGLLLRSPVLEQAERWIASRPKGA